MQLLLYFLMLQVSSYFLFFFFFTHNYLNSYAYGIKVNSRYASRLLRFVKFHC